jgi:heme-degrading monooxygenase HmoA
MIARVWSGRAESDRAADAYQDVFRTEMLDELSGLDGFRGAYLLRREHGGGAEFVALTLFDSLDAVRRFAGEHYEEANVSAAGRAALSDFDSQARHFRVVTAPGGPPAATPLI